MGNQSNLEQWAVMERMRFIERCGYWRGTVNRQDLARVFGLSMAQASADLQRYQQENPGALVYTLSRKRYEGVEEMVMRFGVPVLEEAMAMFLRGGRGALSLTVGAMPAGSESGAPQVYVLPMPERRAAAAVERRLFLAVLNGLKIRVRYGSVNSGTEEWRWLQPRAFVHDGARWHARAWCDTRQSWADFNLSRILGADWPHETQSPLEADPKDRMVVLKARAHRQLEGAARSAVERDFSMVNGRLELKVAGVVVDYLRVRLGMPLADGTTPDPLLEEIRES